MLNTPDQNLPEGYWPDSKVREILQQTQRITLAPDLAGLSEAERRALPQLLAAGEIMNTLYERQLHADAENARHALLQLHEASGTSQATQNLLDLYYLSKGPIVTTLDNQRVPFLPAAAFSPARNVYPAGVSRESFDRFLAMNNGAADRILAERSIVRAAAQAADDLGQLAHYPEVAAMHPGLQEELGAIAASGQPAYYAIPYALAYAAELKEARSHLAAAATILQSESRDFAQYLRARSRDFLSSDYEAGDAAWVTGTFAGLNLQIGSYETYDDGLYGVKAFYGASILARDHDRSVRLESAMQHLQEIENSLPYEAHKRVRGDIPVGVYNVIADFGQARGANTASILPNDADHTRKYGRTILLRYNLLANAEIFANNQAQFAAATADEFHDHLSLDGRFNRTLWHEVGHYLGVDRTRDGRDLDIALAELASLFEEMKSDLVSLYAAPALRDLGYYDKQSLRAVYADGILRTLNQVRPQRLQPYQTMQLMQFNYFLANGLLRYDRLKKVLVIDYERYHDVVSALLAEVLDIQYAGDLQRARDFVDRWTSWRTVPHQALAKRLNSHSPYSRTLVRYAILEAQ